MGARARARRERRGRQVELRVPSAWRLLDPVTAFECVGGARRTPSAGAAADRSVPPSHAAPYIVWNECSERKKKMHVLYNFEILQRKHTSHDATAAHAHRTRALARVRRATNSRGARALPSALSLARMRFDPAERAHAPQKERGGQSAACCLRLNPHALRLHARCR